MGKLAEKKLEKKTAREFSVNEVMHKGCITINSKATLTEAIRKMQNAQVSSLVVEPRGERDAYGIITRLTVDAAADLVLMGTHGASPLERFLSRSVTEYVVRSSRVPVLTVHAGTPEFAPRRILVPFNFAPYAKKALGYAAALAWSYGARITLLNIVEQTASSPVAAEGVREGLETAATGVKGLRTDAIVASGSAEEGILREIQTGLYDLVVLSAHRRRVWTEWVLGTTAERVLRNSRIPVLCVPSEARESRKLHRKG